MMNASARYGDSYTAKETAKLISELGVSKSKQSWGQLAVKSFLAGVYLSVGGLFLEIVAGGSPGLAANYPGIQRTIGAAVFPIGLIIIVIAGLELCTSNFMVLTVTTLQRKTTIFDLVKSWTVSFFGNLIGSMFFGGLLVYYTGILSIEPYKHYAISLAEHKAAGSPWHQIFLKGIGCNWLVCIAVWGGASAKDIVSKVVIIFLPIWFFVAVGFEHVIANMFLIQMGMYLGADLTVGYYIWHSIIPVALGNIVGGGFFVGVAHWYLFLAGTGGDGTSAGGLSRLEAITDDNGNVHFIKPEYSPRGSSHNGLSPGAA